MRVGRGGEHRGAERIGKGESPESVVRRKSFNNFIGVRDFRRAAIAPVGDQYVVVFEPFGGIWAAKLLGCVGVRARITRPTIAHKGRGEPRMSSLLIYLMDYCANATYRLAMIPASWSTLSNQ